MPSLIRRALDLAPVPRPTRAQRRAARRSAPLKEARVAESIEWPDTAEARPRRPWLRSRPTVPLPQRGDHFEAWLKQQRDAAADHPQAHDVTDGLLELYRLHADTRTPLHEHACDGPHCEHEDEVRRG